ncbi:hypothetical protein [Sphingomonas panacisoli]|uniref:hypothetical protein n=1 Tax=Sphingomonas panacisoli TaxID=1813879 RepID=UPI001646318A|nr:hypothetical protein [Sphingomonas panacisoli]
MTTAAIFAGGILTGVLTVLFLLFIGLRWSGDRADDLRDEHAEQLGIGADNFIHGKGQ